MEYKLIIVTPDGTEHPEVPVDDLGEALNTARSSIEKGYLRSPKVVVKLGPGTFIRVMSDEELKEHEKRKVAFPIDLERPWKLLLHFGRITIPMDYDEESVMHRAVDDVMEKGYFFHQIRDGHDYVYAVPMAGSVFLMVSTEEFKERQRRALEAQMRLQQHLQRQTVEGAPQGGLIIPGKQN